MSELYDVCQKIIAITDRKGLDPYKTRGAIAMKMGFLITSISPDSPSDPTKVAQLRDIAHAVLGESV